MEVLEKVNRNESDVSMKTLISFGMGSLGNNIICAMIGTYLTIYLTDSFGISAAAVGTLFLVARIIDAITDPISKPSNKEVLKTIEENNPVKPAVITTPNDDISID